MNTPTNSEALPLTNCSALVVHCKKSKHDVYIGRPSKWGNPFEIGKDGDREEVIQKYREWVVTQPNLMAALPELRGKVLGCWCSPKACHGGVLAYIANHQHGVTDEIVDAVENEVGMGCGAWDMVPPKEIIAAAWKFLPNTFLKKDVYKCCVLW
jgi:hypothetical protein